MSESDGDRWTSKKAAIRGVLDGPGGGGRGGRAAVGRARRARHAAAQAGRRALLGRGARRVQPRQVDVHQRAAGDAACCRRASRRRRRCWRTSRTARAPGATAVSENGDRTPIDAAALADHLTVEGLAKAAGQGDGKPDGKGKATGKAAKKLPVAIHHVEITHPSPLLREPADHRRHAGRQRHQRAARRHHLRLPAARRRGGVPAGRDADPDRVGAAVPGGAHPAVDARPADLRGREGRPARRGRAGGDAALRAQAPARRSCPSRRSSRCRRSARWRAIAAGSGLDAFVERAGRDGRERAAAAAARQRAGGRDAAVGVHPPEPGDPPALAGAAGARAGGADRARAGAAALGARRCWRAPPRRCAPRPPR